MTLQKQFGKTFDITCDCEDGSSSLPTNHIEMIASFIASRDNTHKRMGIRINEYRSPMWRHEVHAAIRIAGTNPAYINIPKTRGAQELSQMIAYIQDCAK